VYEKSAININSHTWYGPDDPKTDEIDKHTVSDLVYRLITNVTEWNLFASTVNHDTKTETWQQWISVEYIHNNLHVRAYGCPNLRKEEKKKNGERS
jgi:hypothetical protein